MLKEVDKPLLTSRKAQAGWLGLLFLPGFESITEDVSLCGAFFLYAESEVSLMAKGKYEYWLTPEGLLKIEGWARDGLTDEQIAQNVRISRETLYAWKKKYPDISDALKRGKDVVDRQVENALLKRALGYEYEEVKEKFEYGEITERTVTKKEVIPDTTAQIFWLKNRKPDKWRDKPAYEDTSELDKLDAILKGLKDNATHK